MNNTPLELPDNFDESIAEFARANAIISMKIETPDYQLSYKRHADTGELYLESRKAIVRVYGKTMKMAIGEDEEHKTFEDARVYAEEYWSSYYREHYRNRSDMTREREARNQAAYRRRKRKDEAARRRYGM